MCWVALDRGARLAEIHGEPELAAEWQQVADEIKRDILEHGVRDGVFRQHYETDALDASVAAAPALRFLPPDDERIDDTVRAIARDLTEHGLVLRYRVEETDDGLTGEEGTFLICSFWLVAALEEIGDHRRAKQLLEKLLTPRLPAAALRRGARPPQRPPARQLPPGLHPPRADQRGHARDRRRRA